jgi:VanZ family protein
MFTLGSFKPPANQERASGGAWAGMAQRYGLMVLVAGAIVYGSLYPFAFYDAGSFGADVSHLAGTWLWPPQSRGDLLANLLLYMPLGLTVALAFGRGRSRGFAAGLALAAGAGISCAVELAQFYDNGRVSTLSDAYLNVMGTLAGAAMAWAGLGRGFKIAWPSGAAATFARFLLFAWLGWRLYPYVPTIDLHKYWRSVLQLASVSEVPAFDYFRYAIRWLSLAFLVDVGLRPKHLARVLAPMMFCFFVAKILVIDQYLIPPDIVGAGLALLVSERLFRGLPSVAIPGLAALLMLVTVSTRVLPWQWDSAPHAFQWIPFYSFLHGSLQVNVISFSEKFYLYGALLLLLVKSGMRLGLAVTLECLVLLGASMLQMFLAGRSAEITDAFMVLLLGLVYWLVRGAERTRAENA